MDSAEAAAAGAAYSATAELEEGLGSVTVGVSRADGRKCNRCWNYRWVGWGEVGAVRVRV